jgi:hypothetical protein
MENSAGGKETVPGVADKLPKPLAGTASNFEQTTESVLKGYPSGFRVNSILFQVVAGNFP